MIQFADVYAGRRVLLTGHTGFKGSWLALWLRQLGAQVTGLALSPGTRPNHWDLLGLDLPEHRVDLRDDQAVLEAVDQTRPEMVFHLAAQSLVRRSYQAPLDTWSTNVLGTVNLLDACRVIPGVRAIIAVTSDKCYENRDWVWGYRETDRLGGHDHYSASKAAAELVVASYRRAHFHRDGSPAIATARAGNVIGGGDWAEDRLIPDLVRAVARGMPLQVRYPGATRPWQHVLESLSGYLSLGWRLLDEGHCFADAWNFGPDSHSDRTVLATLEGMRAYWPGVRWEIQDAPQPHEAMFLRLDSAKARQRLGWQSVWGFAEALRATSEWYRGHLETGVPRSAEQLGAYVSAAHAAGLPWCQ